MSGTKVKFVSRKISKIRWRPKSYSVFITGSCDDDENILTVWKFPNAALKEAEDDEFFDQYDPQAVCTESFSGCVTDLKVISDELFLTSSSLGSISIYKYSTEKLLCAHSWENVHWFKRDVAAATAIASKGEEVASVGEDGRLCIFNFNQMQKIKEIECSDLCSFTAVNYLRHHELVAGNSLGYLRKWDLRCPTDSSSSMFVQSRNQTGISCMNIHPTQNYILATGNDDGSLHVWDMREDKQPVSVLEGHTAAITELLFHPTNPDFMFTCSLDGSVWQWDSSPLKINYVHQHPISTPDMQTQTAAARNPWLSCETNKHRLEIIALSSQSTACVNSLDFSGTTLLWATNNEAVHICNDIVI